jgi:hypothetical protein
MAENHLLDVLTREGVLINVSVRYWRAQKKLQAEDIGLESDDVNKRLISLGHKKLLPREALAQFALIESRAHALVEGNTFPFLGGIGHYLPNTKLGEVHGKLAEMKQEFEAATETFLDQYERLRGAAVREWRQTARQLAVDPVRLIATIEDAFPDSDRMRRYFAFDVNLFEIKVPERLSTGLVTLGDQQAIAVARERARLEAADKISAGVNAFVADCVATLRRETSELCEEMLESMKTGKTGVHQKTLNRLANFMDHFKQLNFAGDEELNDTLEGFRKEFLTMSAEQYRENHADQMKLQRGIRNLADTARQLAQQDAQEIVSRFGQMGVRKFNLAA